MKLESLMSFSCNVILRACERNGINTKTPCLTEGIRDGYLGLQRLTLHYLVTANAMTIYDGFNL